MLIIIHSAMGSYWDTEALILAQYLILCYVDPVMVAVTTTAHWAADVTVYVIYFKN